jgi:hypothetical protein
MATTTPNNGWSVPTSTDYVAQGAVAIETLGDAIDASAGKTWLSWTNYTPSFPNITLGNATTTARYVQIGKTVIGYVRLTFGTTTVMTGGPVFTLPVGAPSIGKFSATAYDTAVNTYPLGVTFNSDGTVYFYAYNSTVTYATYNSVSPTLPFTWGTGDRLEVSFTYETA